jgi:cyclophilin family peptidyl-prolyl cis-trans isomerase
MKWSTTFTPLLGVALVTLALTHHIVFSNDVAGQAPDSSSEPQQDEADDKQADDKQADDKQADDKQADDKQADDEQADGEQGTDTKADETADKVEPITSPKRARQRRPVLATDVATRRYEAAIDRWRDSLKEITRIKMNFSVSKPSEKAKYTEEWIDAIDAHFEALDEVRLTGADAYAAKYQPHAQMEQFLLVLANHDGVNGRFEESYQLVSNLIDGGCTHPQTDSLLSTAALFSNHFAEAKDALLRGREKKTIGPEGEHWLETVDPLIAAWEVEQELRAKEAEADDLPRVLLHTTQGDVVVELFENEAPDTVANFISLVEAGFYDGLGFFLVERGVVAQTGCPLNTGMGSAGYTIYCECFQPNRRHRFAGSLTMAKNANRDGDLIANSAGSQFFIEARPSPVREEGEITVFGRVIEGFGRVSRLQIKGNKEEEEDQEDPRRFSLPDRIISAKVLRKRNHEYVPNKVQN